MERSKAKKLAGELEKALAPLAAKYGLTVSVTGGVIGQFAFRPRVEFTEADGARKLFETYATAFGLKTTDFGRTFVTAGRQYKIVGLKLNAAKRPVLAERTDGKTYMFPTSAIRAALATVTQ